MLSQLGVTLPAGANMQMRNIAAVIVTANLPALARGAADRCGGVVHRQRQKPARRHPADDPDEGRRR
jgi:hypothetical protein